MLSDAKFAVPALPASLGHTKQFRISFNTMRIMTLISLYWVGNSLLFATITPERAGSVYLVFVLFWFWANNRKHVNCYTICLYSVQFIQCTVYEQGNLKIEKGSKHRIRISPKTFLHTIMSCQKCFFVLYNLVVPCYKYCNRKNKQNFSAWSMNEISKDENIRLRCQ